MASDGVGKEKDRGVDYDAAELPPGVSLRAFVRFDRRIDRSLRRLVRKWSHLAAPCAHRGARPVQPR